MPVDSPYMPTTADITSGVIQGLISYTRSPKAKMNVHAIKAITNTVGNVISKNIINTAALNPLKTAVTREGLYGFDFLTVGLQVVVNKSMKYGDNSLDVITDTIFANVASRWLKIYLPQITKFS